MVTISTIQIRLEHTHPIMYLKSIFKYTFICILVGNDERVNNRGLSFCSDYREIKCM